VDGFEGLEGIGVEEGVVEFVDAVEVQKEGDRFRDIFFVVDIAFGIADGATDEHGGTITDITGDNGFGKFRLAKVSKRGVDGVAEVAARVDEGAVEIEDDEAGIRIGRHFLKVKDADCDKLMGNAGGLMRQVWTRREFVAGVSAAGMVAKSGQAWGQTEMTGEAALQELLAGNQHYMAGKITSFPEDLKILKEKTVMKQEPFAAVLSCADSRVPVEIIFDQSIGHLFVTRVAGNMVTPEIMGSIEYGVAVLGVKTILVLGHTDCGAISAAVQGKEVPGQISVLYQHMMPGIRDANGDVVRAVRLNAAFQARLLRESSTVVAKAVKEGAIKVWVECMTWKREK
jgi:carbonic anhydrase